MSILNKNLKRMSLKDLQKYSKMYYFAYGSNLLFKQMFQRCPQSKPISKATLNNYELVFRKVADINKKENKKVLGALYKVSQSDLMILNIYEGYPKKYSIKEGYATLPSGKKVKCFWYEMNNKTIIQAPEKEYLNRILKGYKNWNIKNDITKIYNNSVKMEGVIMEQKIIELLEQKELTKTERLLLAHLKKEDLKKVEVEINCDKSLKYKMLKNLDKYIDKYKKLIEKKEDKKIRIFVYGSLKKGFYNHYLIKHTKFIGKGKIENFDLYTVGSHGRFPAITKGSGEVLGEVYEISKSDLINVNRLEGYKGKDNIYNFYDRESVSVKIGKENVNAYVYVWNKNNNLPYGSKKLVNEF